MNRNQLKSEQLNKQITRQKLIRFLKKDRRNHETTWAHIQASQALNKKYGMPLGYYADSLRTFRFVQGRDSLWRKHVLETDDVETQWG